MAKARLNISSLLGALLGLHYWVLTIGSLLGHYWLTIDAWRRYPNVWTVPPSRQYPPDGEDYSVMLGYALASFPHHPVGLLPASPSHDTFLVLVQLPASPV